MDGLRADRMLCSFEIHPPGDLLGRPSHGKAVLNMGAQADGALNLRAAQLARPGAALGAIGPVAVNTAIAGNLPVDRRPMTAQAAGDLADAKPRLHQAAQAASLLKFKVRVLRSHGDPGHSRCRTWFANLSRS